MSFTEYCRGGVGGGEVGSWYTERVRGRAYEIWEAEGCTHGNHRTHWFRAETELRAAWAKATNSQENLWRGVGGKIEYARYFLDRMQQSLDRPGGARTAVLEASGAILDTQWQRNFYANLDAFLAMARSIPDIVKWCFGVDRTMESRSQLKPWFDNLSPSEQQRRKTFTQQFSPHYDLFRKLALTNARNMTLHRAGYAPVEVRITSLFGISYIGTPVKPVPLVSESESEWLYSIVDTLRKGQANLLIRSCTEAM
jgi:hypothetical protein